jgi:glutathione S-transferase
MRARLALYSSKISHEHREVNLKSKPVEMLTFSPKGTVPVMLLEDGGLLEESLDIMKWALKPKNLLENDALLIQENDSTFKQALDRYKYPGRYSERTEINYQVECESFLEKLENQLSPFLNGNSISFVDLAIFPFIRQLSMVNTEWFEALPYPRIKLWLTSFSSSPLFQEVMQKYLFWVPENKPVIILF